MAKKTRKPNLPEETLARARKEIDQAQGLAAPSTAPKTSSPDSLAHPAVPASKRREVDLRVAYAYVISDLRNMAILAVGLLIFMVVMSLFI